MRINAFLAIFLAGVLLACNVPAEDFVSGDVVELQDVMESDEEDLFAGDAMEENFLEGLFEEDILGADTDKSSEAVQDVTLDPVFSSDIGSDFEDGENTGRDAAADSVAASIVESGKCGENLTWTFEVDGTLIISGIGKMWSFEPEYRHGSSFIRVDDPWSDIRNDITEVIINSGVANIGKYAFAGCSNLTSIVIPDDVTNIEYDAFYGCSSLEKITIPAGVTVIEHETFALCTNLTEITIPGTVERIGYSAFSGCESLKKIYFEGAAPTFDYDLDPDNQPYYNQLGKVAATVFYPGNNNTWTEEAKQDYGGNINWVSVDANRNPAGKCGDNITWKLEDGILTLSGTGDMWDYNYYKEQPWVGLHDDITKVVVESGVSSIGKLAFFGIGSSDNHPVVIIPDSVTSIGISAFLYSYITTITLPDSITSIGDAAFARSWIESIIIPDSVTNISSSAFADSALKSITIPDSITSIGDNAFNLCSDLTSITIPDSVKSIGNSAFYDCYNLVSITLPKDITKIDYSTFAGCMKLTSITIPAGVTSIGRYAFSNCRNLKEIKFTGDAPTFENVVEGEVFESSLVFNNDMATVYYPADNATWTKEVRQNYGGNLAWIPVDENVNASEIIQLNRPETLKTTPVTTGVKLTWTTVPNARKYRVFRDDVQIKTIANTVYLDRKAESGDLHSYYIRAVGYKTDTASFKTSKRSRIATTAWIAVPESLSVVCNRATRVVASWKKDTSVKGYQIRYSLNKDMFDAKTETIRKNTTRKKTVTGLTSGETYYFQVRGYKKIDGKNYYSAWSGRERVKVK